MKRFISSLLAAALLFAAAPAFAATVTGINGAVLAPPGQSGGHTSTILGVNPDFYYGMWLDPMSTQYKAIVDSTATTPAAVGKIVYFTGSTWIQAATANVPLHPGLYGVVLQAATTVGGTAWIQTSGLVSASVKTGGSVACAATGDVPLAITTTGDLTPTAAATVPGVTWAICAGILAISQSATLTPVIIGGY